jgi:putative membrane protein
MINWKHKRLPGMLIAAGLLVPAAAMAQNSQQSTPSTSQAQQSSGASQMSSADKKFVEEAAIGGLAEVQLGKLAVQNAASDSVKQFGQRMVDDHGQANEQLKSIAQAKGMTLPTSLDSKHQKEYDRMSKLSGAEFDRAYMKMMNEDHQKDIKEFKKEAEKGQDADLKSFASSTLPKLHDHLAMAKETERVVKAGGHGSTAAGGGQGHSDSTTGATGGGTENR